MVASRAQQVRAAARRRAVQAQEKRRAQEKARERRCADLGVAVSVALAQPKAINITATLTREAGAPVDLVAQVREALAPALADFARLGRAVSRSWITTRLHVAGVSSVRYTDAAAPAEVTPIAPTEYPVLGVVQLTDGGVA